jgi:hypothetical protein
MREKIRTLHPEGKQGRSIDKGKYEAMCEAILTCLGGGALTHAELNGALNKKSEARFKVRWAGMSKLSNSISRHGNEYGACRTQSVRRIASKKVEMSLCLPDRLFGTALGAADPLSSACALN